MARKWLQGLSWVVLILAVMLGTNYLIKPWYQHAYENYPDKEALKEKTPADLFPWPLIVIVGPIYEEILFRGPVLIFFHLLAKNRRRSLRLIVSSILIVTSGLLFGILHRPNGGIYLLLPVIVQISLQGMLYAWMTIKTEGLICSAVTHMIWNALGYISTGF